MGRKKIKIQPIKEDRNRSVTYLKRKAGLFKKAHELAVLTDSQVAVIVFGHNGKLAEFCSTDIDLLLLRYTEYEGVAERKGPHNYLNNDKDSDDDDNDNDNDNYGNDNDDDTPDGPDDDSSATNPGKTRGNASNSRSVSGIKRKAEQPSPPRNRQFHGSAALASRSGLGDGFDSSSASTSTSSTAKQTVNAALRQKNQKRTSGAPPLSGSIPSQTAFNSMSVGQPFMTGAGMPNNMAGAAAHHMGGMMPAQTTTAQGMPSTSSTNPTRAQAIANMSIPMPTDDRLSMFVSPATPGFGFTPGGSIVTPGGRRFSFSDVLTRGSNSSMMHRPVTANSPLAPTYFQNDAFSLAAAQPPAFSTISPSMSPQQPHGKSALTSTSAAASGGAGATQSAGLLQPPGVTMSASPTPFADMRSGANAMTRPASTGETRSVPPTHNAMAYAASLGPSMTPSNAMASAAHIVRPLTAAANLELPNTSGHLVLPVANFAQSFHATSASPVPHASALNATGMMNNAFDVSSFVGAGLKTSATPFGGSQTSSATPELLSHGNSASVARGIIGASASRSSLSTDEETPPVHVGRAGAPIGNAAAFSGDHVKLEPNAAWLDLGAGVRAKAGQNPQASATLVQPQPINPTQTLGSVPFDLNFPAQPT